MSEKLIRLEGVGQDKETPIVESFDSAQIADWPNAIRELFGELPPEIQNMILPVEVREESVKSGYGVAVEAASERYDKDYDKQDFFRRMKGLEALVSSMDQEDRINFFSLSLRELFYSCQWQGFFERMVALEAKNEATDFLDFIWDNRSIDIEDVPVYQQDYYDNFFATRTPMVELIKSKMAEVEAQKVNVEKTVKQKRLTESKTADLRQLQAELEELQKNLKKFDEKNNNSEYDRFNFKDVGRRQKMEKEWLQSLVVNARYLMPDDLAILVGENFDRYFFSHERAVVELAEKGRREVNLDELDRCMAVLGAVAEAVEEWSSKHNSETAYKEELDNDTISERQRKVAEYFLTLVDSYRHGKKDGRTDSEMEYTIAQMRNSLTILGKPR